MENVYGNPILRQINENLTPIQNKSSWRWCLWRRVISAEVSPSSAATGYLSVLAPTIRMSPSLLVTSIAGMRVSALSIVRSPPVVCRRDTESLAWCLILVPWAMLNLYLYSTRRHRESYPVLCARFVIHFSKSWSVLIVKLILCKYKRD